MIGKESEFTHKLAVRDRPDANGGVPCCEGSAFMGPGGCTCWEPVHDQVQKPPITDMEPVEAPVMCSDCAFRPGSPERTNSEHAVADSDDLLAIVHNPARTFWCHTGLRSTVALRHPSGMELPCPPKDGVVGYDPPTVNGVPYRADGSPGLRCAGLAAARRAKDWTP